MRPIKLIKILKKLSTKIGSIKTRVNKCFFFIKKKHEYINIKWNKLTNSNPKTYKLKMMYHELKLINLGYENSSMESIELIN